MAEHWNTLSVVEGRHDENSSHGNSETLRTAGDGACSPVVFFLSPLEDRDELGHAWRVLQDRYSTSLFQSWGWIDTWLSSLPRGVEPYVLAARRGDDICALGMVCRAECRRYGLLTSKGLFLNETGVPALDALTIEYNGLLCSAGERSSLTAAAASYLAEAVGDWEELYLSGVDADAVSAAEEAGLRVTITGRSPYHFVDLADIRSRKKNYLECLSRNTRSQLRRALRRYEDRGNLEARQAATVEEALRFFGEMKVLHQAYWRTRGQPGAFAKPMFEQFHTAFIRSRFAAGEIRMIRVAIDDKPLGYLYNIAHRKHVYSYQSGFAYEADNAMKPGLVSHYLAIEQNMSEGEDVYDFMAGGGQHKRSLGTASREMLWLRAARPHVKFCIEAAVRKLKRLAVCRPAA